MEIRVLLVDDDKTICEQIKALLHGETINGHSIHLYYVTDFGKACVELSAQDYDLLVLDLFRGKPEEKNPDRPGEDVLADIKKSCFVPVIFFTGLIRPVEQLKSDIVRVVRKSDGLEALKAEIESVFNSKLPLIKKELNNYIREGMRAYFWDFVHPQWKTLEQVKDKVSLGYLIVRRLASSLSKEKIITLLGDSKIKKDKVHPMEFYIYPPVDGEYEAGSILERDGKRFVILTPSCDFVKRKEKRLAEYVLMGEVVPLREFDEYKKFKEDTTKAEALKSLIESRKSRYYFLPGTPFLEHTVIDYQRTNMVPFANLDSFHILAKLDDPYAQAMTAQFIRYYSRIGFPDIDSDFIINEL